MGVRRTWKDAGILLAMVFSAGVDVRGQQPATVVSGPDPVLQQIDRLDPAFFYHRPDLVRAAMVDGRPFLGIQIRDAPLGVAITKVGWGSVGELAGLVCGDKIVEIDRANIEVPADVLLAIDRHRTPRPVSIVVIRHNKPIEKLIQFVPPPPPPPAGVASMPVPAIPAESESDVDQLQSRVERLEREVKRLEDVVRALAEEQAQEARLPPPPVSTELSGEKIVP